MNPVNGLPGAVPAGTSGVHRPNPISEGVPASTKEGAHPSSTRPDTQNVKSSPPVTGVSKFASLEQVLPASLLKDTRLLNAEWGWKQILAQQSSSGVSPEQSETDMGMSLQSLWTLIGKLGETADRAWTAKFTGPVPDHGILPFAAASRVHTEGQNEKIKSWIYHDRLVSSVRTEPYERHGEGLFAPPLARPLLHEEQTSRAVHRWRGKRQTRISSQGRFVHRMSLSIRVRNEPVEVVITAARPALYVHFQVPDGSSFVKYISASAAALRPVLSSLGWQLEQWTTGTPDLGADVD